MDGNGTRSQEWTPSDALGAIAAAGGRAALIPVRDGVAETCSGSELAALVRGASEALAAHGAAPGDTVAIWAANSARWIAAGLACHATGTILAPIDALLPLAEARRQAVASGARLVMLDDDAAPGWGAAPPSLPLGLIRPSARPVAWTPLAADAPIALYRTSGTTGAPKSFRLTLRNVGWSVRAIVDSGDVSARDRVLLPLPMHHVFPWITATLSSLTAGAALVLPESTAGPHVAEALRLGRPTIVIGVPRLYEALLAGVRTRLRAAGPLALPAYETAIRLARGLRRVGAGAVGAALLSPVRRLVAPGLRMLVSGGAHLRVEVEDELEALGWDVRSGYGLAETSASIAAPVGGKRRGSTGRAVRGCEIRIDRPDANGVGEILLAGPTVFAGYLDNPAADASAFTEDGFFRSGDLGRLDADGFLYVTGRAKEVIVLAGGDKLDPEDVEARYLADPLVAEIGVLQRDGALIAVILPDMAEFAKRRLLNLREAVALSVATVARNLPSTWRLSDFVLTHDPLPRTRLMKLRRFLLPDIYARCAAGRAPAEAAAPSPADAAWIASGPRAQVWRLLKREFPDRAFGLDGYITYDLGLDSFGWMNLAVAIERETGIRLTESEIAGVATVRDLLRAVSERRRETPRDASSDGASAAFESAVARWLAPRTFRERVAGSVLYGVNVVLMRLLFRLRVEGREHLAAIGDGPVLLCPNHASMLDPLVLAAACPSRLRARLRWSGSRVTAFGTPFRRAIARPVGMFPVDQTAPQIAVGLAIECLRRGLAQVWFPEGLLSPNGRLLPFHEGVGRVIAQGRAPVLPVVIDGSFAAYPRDASLPRLRRVRVVFGCPVGDAELTEGLAADDPDAPRRIAARLRRRLAAVAAAAGLDISDPPAA